MIYKGDKFSPTQRQKLMEIAARMDRWGYNQFDIARKCGVSQPQVSIWLKKIREDYKKSIIESRADTVAEKLVILRDVRRAAWEAYEKSQKDLQRHTVERRPGKVSKEDENGEADGSVEEAEERIKEIIMREGRLPGSNYLQTILQTVQQEREMLGLDAPTRTESMVNVMAVDWGQVTSLIQEQLGVDQVEKKIAALLPPKSTDVVIEHEPDRRNGNGQAH